MACMHADVELEEPAWLPFGGTHRGLGAMGRVLTQVGTLLDFSTIRLDAIIADGDQAVGMFRVTTLSGEDVSLAEAWTIRDGKVWRGRVFHQDPAPVQRMLSDNAAL
jgi:ketosteroid isomerase-like protein